MFRAVTPRGPIFAVLIGGLCLGGCASGNESSRASAVAESSPTEVNSYYQLVAPKPAAATASQHEEVLAGLRKALATLGLQEASRENRASMVLKVDYTVGPPRQRWVNTTEPVYIINKGRQISQSGLLMTEPDERVYVGDRVVTVERALYEKHLRLSAQEADSASNGRSPRTLWSVEFVSVGQKKDVKPILPVLTDAGRPYLGSGPEGNTVLTIDEETGAIETVDQQL